MGRYKIMVKRLFGYKSIREKEVESKFDELENAGMIDLMTHQLERYTSVTHFTVPFAIWNSWIRR